MEDKDTKFQDQALSLLQRSYEVKVNNPYDGDKLFQAGKTILTLQEELRHLKSVALGIECIATNRMTVEEYKSYEKCKLAVTFKEIIKENNNDSK